jgi:CheY-like chemotaxis protein
MLRVMDAELLAAFLPEWQTACAALAAGDARAAATLRALAEAPGAEALLPLIDTTPPETLATLAEFILHGAPPPASVLVVDDSPTMRRIIREIIAADDAFTLAGEAEDGEAALTAMAALQPALTLLDIEMPKLDGLGVLRRWALTGRGEVVVVSSAAQPCSEVALTALRLGAAGVVAKPSGALSLDMAERRGHAVLQAARLALGMSHAG